VRLRNYGTAEFCSTEGVEIIKLILFSAVELAGVHQNESSSTNLHQQSNLEGGKEARVGIPLLTAYFVFTAFLKVLLKINS